MTPDHPRALVTGAAEGIGRAIAIDLARRGHEVVVTSRRASRLALTLAAVEEVGGRALAFELPLEEAEAAEGAVDALVATFGPLDVLVNNAAMLVRGPSLEASQGEWDASYAVNLRAPFLLARGFARAAVREGRQGVVVNVGSTHGQTVLEGRAVYGVTKAALDQLTRYLALEWAPLGIRVNAVVPATVATPSRAASWSDELRAALIGRIPLGRMGTPEEVAAAVSFLVSPQAAFITGACLPVDGGVTAR